MVKGGCIEIVNCMKKHKHVYTNSVTDSYQKGWIFAFGGNFDQAYIQEYFLKYSLQQMINLRHSQRILFSVNED